MIRPISFEDILPLWANCLWPNRVSKINPTSCLKFLGGIDMTLKKSRPSFWGFYVGDQLTGVCSGFLSSSTKYRVRGLYVDERFRRQGQAQFLFRACEKQALKESASALWSLPRRSAWGAYERFKFERVSDWLDEFEFGPNCFAIKIIGQ